MVHFQGRREEKLGGGLTVTALLLAETGLSWDVCEGCSHLLVFSHFPAQAKGSFSLSMKSVLLLINVLLYSICTALRQLKCQESRRFPRVKITLQVIKSS